MTNFAPIGRPVPVIHDRSDRAALMNEIVANPIPVLLKSYVSDWPAVQASRTNTQKIMDYIKGFDNGVPAVALLGEPDIKGEFFFKGTTHNTNFSQGHVAISKALDRLADQARLDHPYAVYLQSAGIAEHLPGFDVANRLDLVPDGIKPRIWIGNALRVQPHFDLYQNFACLAAGRRRFTLFPPEDINQLYPAPLDLTLAGAPMSMADIENPDFETYPRLKAALAHAQFADLEPGDVLYIPYGWWHHVRSFETFNVLVNYWWNDSQSSNGQAYEALFHAAIACQGMSLGQRVVWRNLFDYFVFTEAQSALAHLPEHDRGLLGEVQRGDMDAAKRALIESMQQKWKMETKS